ncbi:MAG: TRAP transporter small permease subunit [Rhodobacteraceae bacterium]|jgi:TRAP-type C4-dicarboxylate transport system permease small subunit|nr:TRAP transporter small permease subunit [Paracoccaceae bacterium]
MGSMADRLRRAEVVLAGLFVIAMVAMIFLGGTARLLRMPVNATIDFATCFFAWATFLSADVAWHRNRLTALRLVPDRLSTTARWRLDLINHGVVLILLGYGVVAGTWLAWFSRTRTFQGIDWISYSWVTASLPVGCALMILTTLGKVRAHWRDRPGTADKGVPAP